MTSPTNPSQASRLRLMVQCGPRRKIMSRLSLFSTLRSLFVHFLLIHMPSDIPPWSAAGVQWSVRKGTHSCGSDAESLTLGGGHW